MFDWFTWSIWALGFAILVTWTLVPLREFALVLKRLRAKELEKEKQESK